MSTPPISVRLGASWEKVDGWPYHVSDEGNVWSEHSEKMLRPYLNETGAYKVVDLRDEGERKQKYVHVLVLEAHRGPRPGGHEANHRDGDPFNNRLVNLEWIEQDDHDEITEQNDGGPFGPVDDGAPF